MSGLSNRVRVGLGILAVPQLVTGLWAVLATRSWFDGFPGFGVDLIAADPPYNAHLAVDAGAGFLGIGVALLVAAYLAERGAALVALGAHFAFGIPHVVYHLAEPSPSLTTGEQASGSVPLLLSLVLAVVVAILIERERGDRAGEALTVSAARPPDR